MTSEDDGGDGSNRGPRALAALCGQPIPDKIFDLHFTTEGPERETGVGLFICKSIIEKNMHGSLTVRNTERGAEFRIEV